jgi:hypothetical protein
MPTITTGAHPAALWPGVHAWFGVSYAKFPQRWSKIFTEQSSEKAYEEDNITHGFGLARLKPQGQEIEYDAHSQLGTKRYTHDTWGLGFIVTMEEKEDNQYKNKAFQRSKWLARSMAITKEINGANILNRGFDGTNFANGWDGQPLFSASHVSLGGTTSNILTVAADISEAALEDMSIQIHGFTDQRGLQGMIKPKALVIHPSNKFEVHRILKSTLQNDTANNATNALKDMNEYPDGVIINEYLTDTDAWFVLTDVDQGLTHFNRKSLAFTQDNDFGTENALAKAVERYTFGWSDPFGAYGSAGA